MVPGKPFRQICMVYANDSAKRTVQYQSSIELDHINPKNTPPEVRSKDYIPTDGQKIDKAKEALQQQDCKSLLSYRYIVGRIRIIDVGRICESVRADGKTVKQNGVASTHVCILLHTSVGISYFWNQQS